MAQPRQQRAPGRIGKRGEGAVQGGVIVNHMVKYSRARPRVKPAGHSRFIEGGTVQIVAMDPASLAAALVAAQTSRVQFAAAAAMMRMNADAAKSVVQVVQAAEQNAQQLANVAAGIGQNLNAVT